MAKLVVVDGSNIATEGRAMPSLKQLHEAVMAFREDRPDVLVTVVVDATFGHRIEPAEVPEFDAAVEHNELVTPPAGAVGRGDAFVLTIANKANATILSNDSFQEFHGQYPWLFDDGRLIGGKPVPHVGWVFVPRTPVRGATSRKSVRTAREATPATSSKRKAAATAEVDGATPSRKRGAGTAAADHVDGKAPHRAQGTDAPAPGRQQMVNELLPFLAFVEQHPVGTPVDAVTDSYSSHGAYVVVEDTRCYVPLRYLGHPAPRSAREVLKLGAATTFTVVSFNPARRSIDLALAGCEPPDLVQPAADAVPVKRSRKKAGAAAAVPGVAAEVAPVKRSRKKAAAVVEAVPEVAPVKGSRKKAGAAAAVPGGAAEVAPVKRTRKTATTKKQATKTATKAPAKRTRKQASG